MGSKNSTDEMPSDLKKKVCQLFKMIDTDGSKSIDYEETIKFWGSKFAKINAAQLFESVDKNNDGSIQEEEWIEFWFNVYKSGHPKEEIILEVRLLCYYENNIRLII